MEDQSANIKRKAAELDIADKVCCSLDCGGLYDLFWSHKPPVDFFGRPISAAPVSKKSKINSENNKAEPATDTRKHKISFRYNEGNSAAVRKPIKVAAFL